jgi:hypothetical protein
VCIHGDAAVGCQNFRDPSSKVLEVSLGSAARACGRAATCARILRAAESEAAFLDARDDLAGALRDEALRVLTMNGVPAQARDDLAQAVTLTVLARIVDGAVAPGFEDGYVAVAAKNRARDWHREESGVYDKHAMVDEESIPSTTPDPLAVLEHEESEERMRALAARVASVLEVAPTRYRDALVAVYLEGRPIDALVEQELVREWPWPDDDARARARARARVDKLLQRARDWVRARILATEVAAR